MHMPYLLPRRFTVRDPEVDPLAARGGPDGSADANAEAQEPAGRGLIQLGRRFDMVSRNNEDVAVDTKLPDVHEREEARALVDHARREYSRENSAEDIWLASVLGPF